MADGRYLTEDMYQALLRLMSRERAGFFNLASQFGLSDPMTSFTDEHFPGDIYVALVPQGERISARVGSTVGELECAIYRLDDGVLSTSAVETKTVCNLDTEEIFAVEEDMYVPVVKEKNGTYITVSSRGAGQGLFPVHLVTDVCFSTQKVKKTVFLLPAASSSGDLVYCSHEPDDCCDTFATGTGTVTDDYVDCNCGGNPLVTPPARIYATFCDIYSGANSCLNGLQIVMDYSPTSKMWHGFSAPGDNGCGVAIALTIYCYRPPDGSFEMNVNYLWMMYDNQNAIIDRDFSYTPGCNPFNYRYAIRSGDFGIGGPSSVYVKVSETPDPSCGEDTPDPPIEQPVPCCNGVVLPGTLYATLTDCASCSFTTLALFYNSSSNKWESVLNPTCSGNTLSVSLDCQAGIGWRVIVICGGSTVANFIVLSASSCSPFSLVTGTFIGAPCCGSSATVVITE